VSAFFYLSNGSFCTDQHDDVFLFSAFDCYALCLMCVFSVFDCHTLCLMCFIFYDRFGPRESKKAMMYSDTGRLNCNVSYTTFATPVRGQVYKML
jgi:hypothetical protein